MSLDHCRGSRGIISHILFAIMLRHFILKLVIAMPCPLSRNYMKIVNQCPRNSLEWDARSAIYNCSSVNQTCVQQDMFVYHCVVNPNRTMFIEVCAPFKYIYGQKCAEYNFIGSIIQENENNCYGSNFTVSCPEVYVSTDAFKYQSCYDEVKRKTEIVSKNENEMKMKNETTNLKSESNGMSENIIIALLATNLITIVPLVGLLIHFRRNIKKLLNCNSSSKNSTQLSNARKEKDNNTENIFQNGIGSETENVRLYPILN